MRLRWNAHVRHSLAEVLKKVADRGGFVLGLLGWSEKSVAIVLVMTLWWVFHQVLAHLLLATEAE